MAFEPRYHRDTCLRALGPARRHLLA